MPESPYESVVFSGGGSRCFWQMGFWDVAAPALKIRPDVVAATSAGAAFACFAIAGDSPDILNYFKKLTHANKKNFYPENIFRKKPMFPHHRMYRDAVLYGLKGNVMKKLHSGPEIRILVTRPPRLLGAGLGALLGVTAYNFEKHIFYPLHPVFSSKLGFRGEIITARSCKSREDLTELILQSSCAPPLLPLMKRGNKPVLDGGMIDNVPVRILKDLSGKKLVLLTRKYKDKIIPKNPGIHYIQPSEEITIEKWEYTDPEGLQQVYDLGRRDGENFYREQTVCSQKTGGKVYPPGSPPRPVRRGRRNCSISGGR